MTQVSFITSDSPFTSLLVFHSAQAKSGIMLLLEHILNIPASEPLYLLAPLPGHSMPR